MTDTTKLYKQTVYKAREGSFLFSIAHLDSNQFYFQKQSFFIHVLNRLIKLNFDGSLTFYHKGLLSRGVNYFHLFIRINGDDRRIEKVFFCSPLVDYFLSPKVALNRSENGC